MNDCLQKKKQTEKWKEKQNEWKTKKKQRIRKKKRKIKKQKNSASCSRPFLRGITHRLPRGWALPRRPRLGQPRQRHESDKGPAQNRLPDCATPAELVRRGCPRLDGEYCHVSDLSDVEWELFTAHPFVASCIDCRVDGHCHVSVTERKKERKIY